MTTPIAYIDRDELLALQRAEAAELESTAKELHIATLLYELRCAEAELAITEQSYQALKESLAGNS